MSTSEWDGLAWWEQQMYLEGYEWEELVEAPGGSRSRQDGAVREDTQSVTFSQVPGEMTAFGFTEKTM